MIANFEIEEYPRYTVEQYVLDVYNYRQEDLDRRVMGALISAATKRYKRQIALDYLRTIKVDRDLDVTPTLAYRLIIGWLGRGVSKQMLLDMFGEKGRTAANKSENFLYIDELIIETKPRFDLMVNHKMQEAKSILLSPVKLKEISEQFSN